MSALNAIGLRKPPGSRKTYNMTTIRIALAQINPTVGDFAGNTAKIISSIERAREIGADIVAVPELSLPGYPPEDLLLKPQFIAANLTLLIESSPRRPG